LTTATAGVRHAAQVLLAQLLARVELRQAPGFEAELAQSFSLKSKDGVLLVPLARGGG
jgi:hypothetical protein